MQLLDRVSNKAHLPTTIEITLVVKQDAETVKLDAGKMLIDYGIDGPRKVYLNPADFRVFCKLPSNKVIVVVVNSADVASQIRKKAEVVSQTKLANTVLVYGVEEMEDSFTVVDYGIAADATIRIATGGKGDGTGKKWADVDAGNYARTAGKIKVWCCYGAAGFDAQRASRRSDCRWCRWNMANEGLHNSPVRMSRNPLAASGG